MADQPQKPCRSVNQDFGEEAEVAPVLRENLLALLSAAHADLTEQEYERFVVTLVNSATNTIFDSLLLQIYRELEIDQYGPNDSSEVTID